MSKSQECSRLTSSIIPCHLPHRSSSSASAVETPVISSTDALLGLLSLNQSRHCELSSQPLRHRAFLSWWSKFDAEVRGWKAVAGTRLHQAIRHGRKITLRSCKHHRGDREGRAPGTQRGRVPARARVKGRLSLVHVASHSRRRPSLVNRHRYTAPAARQEGVRLSHVLRMARGGQAERVSPGG